MDLIKQYEAETGKPAWSIKDYIYTDEYTKWVKSWAKDSDHIAAKMVREFSKKLNSKKYNNDKQD